MKDKEIEQNAINNYTQNILYIQSVQPSLYEKIISLELAIENGHHNEKYSLEYKDGYFDVMELSSLNFLYSMNSDEHAKIVRESIDFLKTGNLYETFNDVRISDEFAKELESMDITDNSYSGAASLINYSNKYASKEETTMKKIYKFIFLGVGLGTHIKEVHEKIKANTYLIIEDDLELFRLSLFVTNYKEIADDGAVLFFSVFEEDPVFQRITSNFLQESFIYNHYIKFFHLMSHSDNKLKEIQSNIVGQTYLTFNYSALTTSLIRPLIHLKDKYKILNIASSFKESVLTQKPVLMLGAGPSFDKNIEWLKENKNKFILVAVTPLLAKLEELNIKPDIITHVHGFSDAMPHITNVKDPSFFDNTISLFGGFSEPQFIKYFKKENVYIFEGSSRYKRWNTGITASNIGTVTYGLFLMLQTKDIYLLGLDFAPDQESGDTHASTHNYKKKIELQENNTIGGEMIYNREVIKVKGNLREEVFTTLLMNGWKEQCNAISQTYKDTCNENIYNLGDGALIDDTTPTKIEDCQVQEMLELDKNNTYLQLRELFDLKSENFLNDSEIKNIQRKIDYCNSIINILKTHIKSKHSNLDQYHYDLIGVFYNILTDENDIESSDMNYVITLYLKFVSGYIFDLINTKEIKDHKKLMKLLDNVVIPQIIRVINYFKYTLKDFIEFSKKA